MKPKQEHNSASHFPAQYGVVRSWKWILLEFRYRGLLFVKELQKLNELFQKDKNQSLAMKLSRITYV